MAKNKNPRPFSQDGDKALEPGQQPGDNAQEQDMAMGPLGIGPAGSYTEKLGLGLLQYMAEQGNIPRATTIQESSRMADVMKLLECQGYVKCGSVATNHGYFLTPAGRNMAYPGTARDPGFSKPERIRARQVNRMMNLLGELHEASRRNRDGQHFPNLNDAQDTLLGQLVEMGLAEPTLYCCWRTTPQGGGLAMLDQTDPAAAVARMETLLAVLGEQGQGVGGVAPEPGLVLHDNHTPRGQQWEFPAGLTFAQLRNANLHRATREVWGTFGELLDWTPTDWATAMGGEAGEALNQIKKLRREFGGQEWLAITPDDLANGSPRVRHLVSKVADELADVQIYLDLLAARLGIDLAQATARKFNRTSEEKGSPIRLPVWPLPAPSVAQDGPGEPEPPQLSREAPVAPTGLAKNLADELAPMLVEMHGIATDMQTDPGDGPSVIRVRAPALLNLLDAIREAQGLVARFQVPGAELLDGMLEPYTQPGPVEAAVGCRALDCPQPAEQGSLFCAGHNLNPPGFLKRDARGA